MATDTEHYEVLVAAHARVQLLGLKLADGSPLPDAQVYLRKLPTDRDVTLPAVFVTLPQDQEEIGEGNFEEDQIGYPVLLTHAFATNQSLTLDELQLKWRKTLRRGFHGKTLQAANPQIKAFGCQVFPRPIINVGLFREQNLDVGALLVRAWVTEQLDRPAFE